MKKNWQDWGNLVLGLWIFASPWIFQLATAGNAVTWNLYVVGIAVTILALMAIFAFQAWEEWTNLVLGLWLLVSPWALGFSSSTLLMLNAVIAGALVAILAGWVIAPPQDSSAGPAKHA